MTIKLFIDNMMWRFFIDNNIDVNNELPVSEFSFYITKEAEFEICEQTPKDQRDYVQGLLDMGRIKTDTYFGFYDEMISQQLSGQKVKRLFYIFQNSLATLSH